MAHIFSRFDVHGNFGRTLQMSRRVRAHLRPRRAATSSSSGASDRLLWVTAGWQWCTTSGAWTRRGRSAQDADSTAALRSAAATKSTSAPRSGRNQRQRQPGSSWRWNQCAQWMRRPVAASVKHLHAHSARVRGRALCARQAVEPSCEAVCAVWQACQAQHALRAGTFQSSIVLK